MSRSYIVTGELSTIDGALWGTDAKMKSVDGDIIGNISLVGAGHEQKQTVGIRLEEKVAPLEGKKIEAMKVLADERKAR